MQSILVLEDEFPLLKLIRQVLDRHGYVTWTAPSAEDAIRRFREGKGQIDLLVADVSLPVSSGIQIALLLRTQRPDLSVILMSGHPPAAWKDRDYQDLQRLGPDSVVFLRKPFEPRTLINSIQELTRPVFARNASA